MPIYEFEGRRPSIDPSAYIAPSAIIIGRAVIGPECYVGHGAILRADYGTIEIGAGSAVLSLPSCNPDCLPRYPEQARWLEQHCGSLPGVSRVWSSDWHIEGREAIEFVKSLLGKHDTPQEDDPSPDRAKGGE